MTRRDRVERALLALETARRELEEALQTARRERTRAPFATLADCRKGGLVRAKKLSPERRREIARKAIAARWARKQGRA